MAIDTLKLKVYVSDEVADAVIKKCVLRQAIDMSDGILVYQLTSGSLAGTYDSRISIKVGADLEKYLIVECSVHKALLGHNVYGGTDDLFSSVIFLHNLLGRILQFDLPFSPGEWLLMRIDLAEIYDLGSFEACQEWFRWFNTCSFPRRQVSRYGTNGIAAYGQVTSIKSYHKGPDFWVHDRRRLVLCNYPDVDGLVEKANNIIRVEVEVKSRKLKDLYNGDYPRVDSVDMDGLYKIYDREVYRFMKEGKCDIGIVRNTVDVRNRLFEKHSDSLASSLLATWYQLTTLGEDWVKKNMKKSNYYNHLKYLKQDGVSWHGTDIVKLDDSLIPRDFTPVRSDIRRVVGECPELMEKLEPYRQLRLV